MATEVTPDRMMDAITRAIRTEIDNVIKEETEAAVKRVHERIAKKADTIALSLLSHYDVMHNADRLIITVKKAGNEVEI